MRNDLAYLMPTQQPALPAEPAAADPPDLWDICQRASYPLTFEWLGGERTTYTAPDEAYFDLWARSLVKEALALGGQVSDKPGPAEC